MFFSSEKRLLPSLTVIGNVGSVAVNADGTLLASANEFLRSVTIYTMDGKGDLTGPPVIVGSSIPFACPKCLCFVHRGGVDSLLIVDRSNSRVVEVTTRGEFMRAIRFVLDPVSVAYCEKTDRIAVSFWDDQDHFTVLSYSTELRVGKKRPRQHSFPKMCIPLGISFYKGGRFILVADWGNHCVNMFSAISGTFVSVFASRAEGVNWPRDVHVLGDGSVIVQQGYSGPCSVLTFPVNGRSEKHVFGTGAFYSAYSSLLHGIIIKSTHDGSVFLLADTWSACSRCAWLSVLCRA